MLVQETLDQLTLGEEIDRFFELREKIRAKDDEVKELKTVFDQRKAALIERIDAQGMVKATGRRATISIKETVVANVENWDEFYRYIHRNKAYHLLERRPANAAYRELLDARNKPVPGVVPFKKRDLSLTTV